MIAKEYEQWFFVLNNNTNLKLMMTELLQLYVKSDLNL